MSVLPQPLVAFLKDWRKDDVTHLSAALAYYAVFSLPSLLLLVVAVGAFVVGDELIREQTFQLIDRFVTGQAGELLKSTVRGISEPGRGLAATVVAVLGLLVGGTAIIREAQGALKKICGEDEKTTRLSLLTRLFRAALAIPVVSVLLVAAIASSTVLGLATERVAAYIAVPPLTITAANGLLSFVTLALLVGALYALLLPRRLPAGAVLAGTALSAVLLVLSRTLLGFYAAAADLGAAYGVAASLLILLLWTYVAALIFLTGAELAAFLSASGTPPKRQKRR